MNYCMSVHRASITDTEDGDIWTAKCANVQHEQYVNVLFFVVVVLTIASVLVCLKSFASLALDPGQAN